MTTGKVKVKKVERSGGILAITLSASEFVKLQMANKGITPPAPPPIKVEEQADEEAT